LELRRLRPDYKSFAKYEKGETKIPGVGLKKMHEIYNLSNLIKDQVNSENLIVDFGSGLGYLSQLLWDQFGYRVIGLEGSKDNFETAISRQKTEFPKSEASVQYFEHFIAESSLDFVKNLVGNQPSAIVGLHACADLTITAIKLFFDLDNVGQLLIMPCCYHRLELVDDREETFKNLPLSRVFRSALGSEEARMINVAFARLACQHSAVRWRKQTQEDHEAHGKIMFERALVELLPEEGESIKRNSNTRKLEGQSWEHIKEKYTLLRDNAPKQWSDIHEAKFKSLVAKYPNGNRLSQYLKCLQNCVQSLCEHVIMVDRLAFIQEMCESRAIALKTLEYRKIVDDDLSPRGFVLIVEK